MHGLRKRQPLVQGTAARIDLSCRVNREKEMRVGFVTFGCRLNRAEALDLETQYAAAGWEVVTVRIPASPSPHPFSPSTPQPLNTSTPDRIIVRGCSVTAKAQRDCEKAIAHLRARFPRADIRLTGCLPEATGDVCPTRLNGATAPSPATQTASDSQFLLSDSHSRAYLKVQDGCSGKCAYCIVPTFRGPPVSTPFDEIIARARALIAAGYRELVITGCNLCLYRNAGRGLPELAAALAGLESPGHRIRLGSIEPGLCDARLIDALESHPNICRFIHLSLQSGSDRVLRLMRRPYTMEQIAAFCGDARRRLGPRLALGADLITGFPGETDDDFAITKDFLSSPPHLFTSPFLHLHVFPYSERPGTEAATMKPAVPMAIRRIRARELERIGATNRATYAQALTGREVVVCVEKDGNGRTDEYLRCLLNGAASRRSLVRAMVTEYFPKTGALSATICAQDQKEEHNHDNA